MILIQILIQVPALSFLYMTNMTAEFSETVEKPGTGTLGTILNVPSCLMRFNETFRTLPGVPPAPACLFYLFLRISM